MLTKKITDGIFYVGVNDRTTTRFEGLWPLPYGVSYNSYLVAGNDKTAIIDGVEISHAFEQIAQIKKMGNLKDLASMIPGVGKAIKDVDIDDNAFKGIEAIIQSMTPLERRNPEIITGSRRQRPAKGRGTSLQEVNRLLKQFESTRKMMKMATSMKSLNMMRKMRRH